jgi:predicted RecA/RadA family phage recombinase|tara:strand:- start:25 stop:414 length:390 start_codon:yes stop_codon:yes gene_type:complete
MATEILVNDGGAPARILPFTAGSAVTGGRLVAIASDGKVDHAASGATNSLGVAFTDAGSADGEAMSVITGKGVILNVSCSGTFVIGQALTLDNFGNGTLTSGTSNLYGVALESGSSTAASGALGKVLMY